MSFTEKFSVDFIAEGFLQGGLRGPPSTGKDPRTSWTDTVSQPKVHGSLSHTDRGVYRGGTLDRDIDYV